MKKFLLSFMFLACGAAAFAQTLADGFYRVQNRAEKRYMYITDNTGTASVQKQDLTAVQLIEGFDLTISNPATVLYVKNVSGKQYNIYSQETSLYEIIGKYPELEYIADKDAYRVGATISGATFILAANNTKYDEIGVLSLADSSTPAANTLWVAEPIVTGTDNYFGIEPSIEIDGKYYQPFYASFAYSFASPGMKAYYVARVDGDVAKLVTINSDIIPEATPVIIECSSKEATNNRLELMFTGGTAITNNLLKGNYFCNDMRPKTAVTDYDANTMRVLGKTADGKLGFVVQTVNSKKPETKYLAANQSYLGVAAGTAQTLSIVVDDSADISLTTMDEQNVSGVYSILGVKLRQDSSLDELPMGIYIVNGKKVVKR